jgi:hypothetical protein
MPKKTPWHLCSGLVRWETWQIPFHVNQVGRVPSVLLYVSEVFSDIFATALAPSKLVDWLQSRRFKAGVHFWYHIELFSTYFSTADSACRDSLRHQHNGIWLDAPVFFYTLITRAAGHKSGISPVYQALVEDVWCGAALSLIAGDLATARSRLSRFSPFRSKDVFGYEPAFEFYDMMARTFFSCDALCKSLETLAGRLSRDAAAASFASPAPARKPAASGAAVQGSTATTPVVHSSSLSAEGSPSSLSSPSPAGGAPAGSPSSLSSPSPAGGAPAGSPSSLSSPSSAGGAPVGASQSQAPSPASPAAPTAGPINWEEDGDPSPSPPKRKAYDWQREEPIYYTSSEAGRAPALFMVTLQRLELLVELAGKVHRCRHCNQRLSMKFERKHQLSAVMSWTCSACTPLKKQPLPSWSSVPDPKRFFHEFYLVVHMVTPDNKSAARVLHKLGAAGNGIRTPPPAIHAALVAEARGMKEASVALALEVRVLFCFYRCLSLVFLLSTLPDISCPVL